MAMTYDQNIAMAAAGGLCFMLAVSVTIPLQTRFFFAIGSGILGYIVGLLFMAYGDWGIFAAVIAFFSSAIGSTAFASIHKWVNGGPTPRWITFIVRILPFGLKKDGGSQ